MVVYYISSTFQQGLADLNSEFSFFKTCCYTKFKEPSQPYYLSIAGGGENNRIHPFSKGINAM